MVVVFLTCTSFVLKTVITSLSFANTNPPKKIVDFNVHRFSGEKVFLSWHTEEDSKQIVYEVLRKHERLSQFVSLGIIQPKEIDDNSADYSFIDVNSFEDSSYYCLKRTTQDSVVFFSITKGVEGITMNRRIMLNRIIERKRVRRKKAK